MSNQAPLTSTQSFSSDGGDTMSPTMRPRDWKDPIQVEALARLDGGTTSAIGLPKRVTRLSRREH